MKQTLLFFFISSALLLSCATQKYLKNELKVVDYVDLGRYIGKWYEIARFPTSFEKDCIGATAVYIISEDKSIKVINECYKKTFDGKKDKAVGKAWVVDKKTNAKLKVQFFWPFRGDYWIIELGKEYDYAVVSEGTREYLWILCRKPFMNDELYNGILDRLKQKGFDTTKIYKTPQRADG